MIRPHEELYLRQNIAAEINPPRTKWTRRSAQMPVWNNYDTMTLARRLGSVTHKRITEEDLLKLIRQVVKENKLIDILEN